MALGATFMPEGNQAEGIEAGQSNARSLMDRADEQRIRDQQADQQAARFEIEKPVLQAQALANVATAHAAISTATRMQGLRAQAAIAAGPANDEFLAAQQWNDPLNDVEASDGTPEGDAKQAAQVRDATQAMWDGRSLRLSALQAKYSWMNQIPEYKGFVDALNQARLEAHGSALANLHLTGQLMDAQTAAASREAVATTMAGSRQGVAETNAAARTTAAETGANARVTSAGLSADARVDSAKARADHTYEFEKTKALYDQAVETGDESGKQLFGARLQKMNAIAGQDAQPLPTATPRPAPASGAPAEVKAPEVRTVQVGDAHYPVYVKKSTKPGEPPQRGYLKDGKIIPLVTETAAPESP